MSQGLTKTNASPENLSQLNGTTVDTNSGTKSAGTLRVVLATDQPALSNKLLVTPDLPSGAATAAKQPALGTAGTPSADVITVQGTTSMTALKVDGTGGSFPVSGTVSITSNSAVNVAQINGVTPLMGNGATGTGSARVTVASDNTPFAIKTDQTTHGTTDLVAADITKVNGQAVNVGTGTAGTGTQRVAVASDSSLTLAAGTNNIGFVTPTPGTTGGWTKWSTPKNNSNTALVAPAGGINVAGAACTLGGYMIYNPNSAVAYVQVFDLAGATASLGTTRPDMVLAIPGLSSANLEMVNGVKFTNGVTVAATTTDSGSVAVSTGLTVTLWYK